LENRGRLVTEQPKNSQIANINQQIKKLREQINEANVEIKKIIEKRDMLHEKIRNTRQEINKLKAERDDLNQKVKLLKEQRDAVRVQIAPIMDEIKALKEKISELKKNLPRVSQKRLQAELDAIEWKIQTTSLDLQEEKELIENVKQLEIQLSNYKKIDAKYQKIRELLEHRKTFDAQAEVYHKELSELAQKSQNLHAVMMEKVNANKKDKAEADSLHQAFIKAKQQNNLLYEQIKQLMGQSMGLRVILRDENQAKRLEEEAKRKAEKAQREAKEQELKNKLGSEAREKLQRGEKVSWDEFQLLMGDDEDDAETQD
jgi:uncharacterized coiled-coil DUF342 family protein